MAGSRSNNSANVRWYVGWTMTAVPATMWMDQDNYVLIWFASGSMKHRRFFRDMLGAWPFRSGNRSGKHR